MAGSGRGSGREQLYTSQREKARRGYVTGLEAAAVDLPLWGRGRVGAGLTRRPPCTEAASGSRTTLYTHLSLTMQVEALRVAVMLGSLGQKGTQYAVDRFFEMYVLVVVSVRRREKY